jgi:hypothetical protein
MRVIFLDIDGVLNCKRPPNPRKFPYIVDQKLVERFRGLVARADAAVPGDTIRPAYSARGVGAFRLATSCRTCPIARVVMKFSFG